MFEKIDPTQFLDKLFTGLGMSENLANFLRTLIIVAVVALLSWLANLLARFIIDRVVTRIVRRTRFKWDDIFLESKVFNKLSHFAPALVIWLMAGWALSLYPGWLDFVREMTYLYMIIIGTMFLFSFIEAWHHIYNTLPVSKHRHIKGYVQVAKIIVGFIAVLIIVSVVFDKEISTLVAGLGAMAAVLILVFKDTILGLVASVQLSSNKMVSIGDWVTMPSKGADGTVIDISLNTVKVQNFDKTIITIPTYALVQDSFQNWVGMEESGGRRIKRAINIDMKTVAFLSDELRTRLMKIQILKEYIVNKQKEMEKFNLENGVDNSVLVNGRRLTNLGTFRAYVEAYLRNHPKIHNDMTFLVRQLKPTEAGLPIEIYVFANDQEWARYEAIQADIFDHLLAVIPEFGLQVFQNPSGDDFRALKNS
jgi:miniconductance mechanosensitive channel